METNRINEDLKTWLVDIEAITTPEWGSLDVRKAELMYRLGGSVKPMVLRASSVEEYTVVRGFDTFLCAQYIADRIDDDFEMIRAYIAQTDEEEALLCELYDLS